MTPGDIVTLPSGRLARYEGGGQFGAEFVYLDANRKPIWIPSEESFDSFCTKDLRLLMKVQPDV